MPFYAFIHPIWQIATFILGIYNVQIGMGKKSVVKAFPLSRHRRLGWIFFIMAIIGALIGKIVNSSLINQNINLKLPGHQFIGFVVILLVGIGIIFSELGITNQEKYAGILKWHPWLNILALGFLTAQAFVGILALLGI